LKEQRVLELFCNGKNKVLGFFRFSILDHHHVKKLMPNLLFK